MASTDALNDRRVSRNMLGVLKMGNFQVMFFFQYYQYYSLIIHILDDLRVPPWLRKPPFFVQLNNQAWGHDMGFNHENLRNHGDYMGIIVGECLYPAVFFTVCPHKSPFFKPNRHKHLLVFRVLTVLISWLKKIIIVVSIPLNNLERASTANWEHGIAPRHMRSSRCWGSRYLEAHLSSCVWSSNPMICNKNQP